MHQDTKKAFIRFTKIGKTGNRIGNTLVWNFYESNNFIDMLIKKFAT